MVVLNVKDLELLLQSMPPFAGVKGSIVRLKIHDFMTYHKVELRAGANVNLILGPNGTGKSTIVCAICIGLAGKTKILGRASSLKEYIRHGCTSATTEIELFNPEGQNYVVKRHIKETGTGASSRWYLNNAKVQPIVIDRLLTGLNIQLDNLCQFLPQDRVQEFAKMDSCSLLRSTQQALAIGNESLIKKHDELIEMNEKVKQTEYSLKANTDTLRAEQQYNQRLENEVKNYHEREKFKEQIALLNGKKAWIVYLKSVKIFSKLNAELETMKNKKKDEESKLAPMKKSVQVMESKLVKFRQEMNNCRNQNVSLINSVKRRYEDDCDAVELKVNEINSELAAQERTEQERLKRVLVCTQKIASLEEEYEQLRTRGDLDEPKLVGEINAIESKVTKLSEKIFKIVSLNEADEFERRDLLAKMRSSEVELRRLDDLRNSRMKFLQRDNRDLYQAVEFFSKPENRARLKGEIHEPMILHLCVNDLKYGQMVERHIGVSDMLAYFCENKDDLEVILELSLQQNLRISVIHHQVPSGFERPRPSYNQDFLRKYHFIKVLVELIEAPDYYLSFICKKHRPQDVPIGDSETDKFFSEITQKTSLSAFYTAECSYSIKKSHYGVEKCTSVNYLSPARIFTSEINAAERERLEDLVKNFKSEVARLERQVQSRTPEVKKLESERTAAEDEMKNIHARINYRRQLENKLTQAKRSKEMLDRDVPDLETMRETSKNEIWLQRAKKVNAMEWAVNELDKNAQKGRQLIILKRQVSVLQSRIITKQNQLEDLEGSINQNNGQIKTLSDEVEAKASEADRNKKEALSKLPEATQDVTDGSLTADDVDKELNLAVVQLRFLVDVDASIVKDYEERLRKIDLLTRKRGADEEKLADVKQEILRKKTEWLDPLQNLIDRINDNFGRFFASMGCAGEVSLCYGDNENDFAKYGIKIMVKFRASEPLAEMCGSKGGTLQSGGERVITTALYVLALQELTVVPFRVIDEINQGMDAKNESRFFNLLCSMAQGENTPQYFLLTPKMLPPVDYPDNVEFHFIMNGPKVNVPFDGSDEDEDDVSEGEGDAVSDESSEED